MELKGKTALVTGASSGLGEQFARQLAARKADVVVAARRTERLEKLASDLKAAHGVQVDVLTVDLATPEGAERLFAQTEGAGRRVDVLVNNAGFGTFAWFTEMDLAEMHRQLQLNVVTLTELCWRFSRPMRDRRQGWILNVSSIGAYVPSPGYATYSAGKSYVRSFSEALHYELSGSGVRVLSLCPGLVTTEFHAVARHELPSYAKATAMSAEECARRGLNALFAGRRNVVPGFLNKLMALALTLLPNAWAMPAALAGVGRPPRRAADQAGA